MRSFRIESWNSPKYRCLEDEESAKHTEKQCIVMQEENLERVVFPKQSEKKKKTVPRRRVIVVSKC